MPTTREFFLAEANEALRGLEDVLAAARGDAVDAGELHRLARGLRGAAQLGREDRVRRVAGSLETVARSLSRGEIAWNPDLAERVRATVEDLDRLARNPGSDADADAAVDRALARWEAAGIVAAAGVRPTRAAESRDRAPEDDRGRAETDFLRYAGQEVAGILAELEAALPALTREPRAREPLKAILRRQRALLGAARLDAVPAVAEPLRTVDEITRLIAKLDVPVHGYWIETYRSARDVLGGVVQALQRGDEPPSPSEALIRMRTLRNRLLEQHGGPDGARSAPAPAIAEELPLEVVNFFRSEAASLLDRIQRLALDLPDAATDRGNALRRDLRDALTALRDIARTFGFAGTVRLAESALADEQKSHGTGIAALLPELRRVVAGEAPGQPAGTPIPQEPPPMPAPDTADPPAALQPQAPAAAPETGREEPVLAEPPATQLSDDGAETPDRQPDEPATADEVVPIESLCYAGDAALRRALELRPALDRASANDRSVRETLDELFDLIRLGMA